MDVEGRKTDDIVFDSATEMNYYLQVVVPKYKSGEIVEFKLQKPYELQPACEYQGKAVRAITYVADFWVKYADGHEEIIDIKGYPDAVAKLKRKMFWYKYPDLDYKWIKYTKKFGGWITYEEYNRMKREEKKAKKKAMEAKEAKEKEK